MIVKEQVIKEFQQFLVQNYPLEYDNLELKVIDKREKEGLNEENVKDLVFVAYKSYFQTPHPTGFSNFFNPVRQLARAFDEHKYIEELESIWNGKSLIKYFGKSESIPIPIVEQIIFRDTSVMGFRVGQTYNYGHGTIWRLGEFIELQAIARKRVFDILQDILLKNNVRVSFEMADLAPAMLEKGAITLQ